jgi:hypothetical protein
MVVYLVFLFLNLGAIWRLVANATLRPLCPEETYPVLIAQEARCALEPICRDAEILAPTRSESLY